MPICLSVRAWGVAEGSIYWRDVGTFDSYWRAHMDLVAEYPQLNLFGRSWPIRGLSSQSMPSKFFYKHQHERTIDNSMISGGCLITDAEIKSSVLFERVTVNEGSVIEQAVVLPQVKIGKNCIIRNGIIERACNIPDGMQIGVDLEKDAEFFRVSSGGGLVLVTPAMLEKRAKTLNKFTDGMGI